jgi:prolipoprotein diacylglyceryltransferase
VIRLGDFGLSMGQLLSLPMILAGAALLVLSARRPA